MPLILTLFISFQVFAESDKLLSDIAQRSFRYFIERADPRTGIVADRAKVNGQRSPFEVGSIATTGFGLSALCVGVENGWISRQVAESQVLNTLNFLYYKAPQKNGWYYHWMDMKTGQPVWDSEVSSIDTALFLAGALTVSKCFSANGSISHLADLIYRRVDFKWMLNGDKYLLSHGWLPKTGFLPYRWDSYCEHLILYLLAIASPTHPISLDSWYKWARPQIKYGKWEYIYGSPPLFVHQFSHAWIDFRKLKEKRLPHTNWFLNSQNAIHAQKEFCNDLGSEFPSYSENVWGISASDSAFGYVAWGGPPRDPNIDGTIVPYASLGSVMISPEISLRAVKEIFAKYSHKTYGHYGFVDAFNPLSGWVDTDVIGLDVGISLLSIANYQSQGIWKWFMKNPEIQAAIKKIFYANK